MEPCYITGCWFAPGRKAPAAAVELRLQMQLQLQEELQWLLVQRSAGGGQEEGGVGVHGGRWRVRFCAVEG